MSSLLLLGTVALVANLVNLSSATSGNDPQNISPGYSRLKRALSPDAARLKREFSADLSLYPGRLERNVPFETSYLHWPLFREDSRLKRKISSALGRLKRDVSSDPSRLQRDVSSDLSHLKPVVTSVPSRLQRDVSSDPSHLKPVVTSVPSRLKRDVPSDPSHLKPVVSSDPGHLKRDVSSDSSHLKRDISSDSSHLKRDVSSDSSHLKRDVSSDSSHLKRDVSSDLNHLKRVVSSDSSHLKRDVSSDAGHLKRDVSSDPNRREHGLSPDPRSLFAASSPFKRGVSRGFGHPEWDLFSFFGHSRRALSRHTSLPSLDRLLVASRPRQDLFSAGFRPSGGNIVPSTDHLKLYRSPKASSQKQDFSSDPSSNFQQISISDPSHLKRDASTDASHLKRDLSSDASHLKRYLSSDASHLKRDRSPSLSRLNEQNLSPDLHHFKDDLSPDLRNLNGNLSPHPLRSSKQVITSPYLAHPDSSSAVALDFDPHPKRLIKRSVFPDPTHVKDLSLSPELGRLKRDLSLDLSHLRRDLSLGGSPGRRSLASGLSPVRKRDTSPGGSAPDFRGEAASRVFQGRSALSPPSSSSSSSLSSSSSFSKRASSVESGDAQSAVSAAQRVRRHYTLPSYASYPSYPSYPSYGYQPLQPYINQAFSDVDDPFIHNLQHEMEDEVQQIHDRIEQLKNHDVFCRQILNKLHTLQIKHEKKMIRKKTSKGSEIFLQVLEEMTNKLKKRAALQDLTRKNQLGQTAKTPGQASSPEITQLQNQMAVLQTITVQLMENTEWLRHHLDDQDPRSDDEIEDDDTKDMDIEVDRRADPKPAFFVKSTEGHGSLETAENGALKFTQVVTNAGDCYNSTTGQFTAPSDGNYKFFLNFHTAEGPLKLGIYRSGNEVFGTSGDNNSNSVIISLAKGEHVYVKECNGGSVASLKHVTFSGSLN